MKKQTIKLNESQLKQMIKEALSRNDVLSGQKYWQDETPKGEMNKIRHSRYQGLVEIIEYYSAQDDDGKSLSKEQCEQLKNACDTIECFGELGQQWAKIGKEILSRNEHASINESQLTNIIRESVKKVLYERKPADRQVGPHLFKGVKYDRNGNPNYTCDTVPDDWKKTMRWKMSQKNGLHGQLGDPSKVPGVISEEHNSDAFSLMNNVRKCVMLNLASEIGGNHHEITRGENNSILVINRDNPSEGVKISFDFYQSGLN